MTYKNKIKIKKLIINIELRKPFRIFENGVIFGYPNGFPKKKIKNINENQIKNLSGYFFLINFTGNNINFYTDVVGNLRVYYFVNKNNVYVNDNLKKILWIYKKVIGKISINYTWFNFYKAKNYTPGHKTFFENIQKFEPCSKYFFFKGKIKNISYFPNHANKPNINFLQKKIFHEISQQLLNINSKNIVLLFSGGKDSLLIFNFLLKNKIKFECTFYETHKKSDASLNKEFVINYCKKKNIKLTIFKVSLKVTKEFKKFFFGEMLFDYHFSLLHFNFFKQAKKIYKKDTVFITGQSCDSLLSLGPSQYTLSNYVARFINLYPLNILNYFFCKVINKKYKSNLTQNSNKNFYSTFYNSFFYYSLNNFKNNNLLKVCIDQVIEKFFLNKMDKFCALIFLKCHGFLQGPDNQVIIKTANYHKFNNILMPFASIRFIGIISKYYNVYLDLIFPKYIIDFILIRNFNFSFINFIKNIFCRTSMRKNNEINLSIKNSKFKQWVTQTILRKYETA
jgi:hypothetical protein